MRTTLVGTAIVVTLVWGCSNGYTAPGDTCGTNVPAGTVAATNSLAFIPSQLTVSANQSVNFQFCSTAHNVVFDNSNPNRPADIPTSSSTTVARTFTVPGTYEYVCTIHAGMHGEVIVQ